MADMQSAKALLAKSGLRVPRVLYPCSAVEYTKFAVIACDQFSAQPEYWEDVEHLVGSSPSALRMMLPEAWLQSKGQTAEAEITDVMRVYLDNGTLIDKGEMLVYVERETAKGTRKGLIAAFDLEQYDFRKNAKTLVRATEETVVDRLPARVRIRETAPLELPHILVLVDDKKDLLMKAVESRREFMSPVYDFELMMDGGHIKGFSLADADSVYAVADALQRLDAASAHPGFLFAMGDGNHSFAAAKKHWDNLKKTLSAEERKNHPARFALAEIVNIYDKALTVEPIHRLISGVDPEKLQTQLGFDAKKPPSLQELQPKLDKWLARHKDASLEYIHGAADCRALARKSKDRLAVVFGKFDRSSLFRVVLENGVFVRKSFSLGSAREKRYYLECRKITY